MRTEPVSWTRSLLAAGVATYLPFVLLALFMLGFERQWGNVTTAVRLLPYGPGVLPMVVVSGLLRRLIDTDLLRAAAGLMPYTISAAFVLAVASLGRLGREWLVGGTVVAFFVNAVAAYWLVGAIRM